MGNPRALRAPAASARRLGSSPTREPAFSAASVAMSDWPATVMMEVSCMSSKVSSEAETASDAMRLNSSMSRPERAFDIACLDSSNSMRTRIGDAVITVMVAPHAMNYEHPTASSMCP